MGGDTFSAPIVDELPDFVNQRAEMWKRFRRNKAAMIGLIWALLMMFVAVFGPLIQRVGPKKIFRVEIDGYKQVLSVARPSSAHWFGTNRIGQDVWSRLITGARISFTIAFAAIFVSLVLSILIGGITGYFRGWVDNLFMRFADILLAIPYLLMVLAFRSFFGQGIFTIVAVITFLGWMGTARLFRAGVMSVSGLDYVEAARASGCSTWRIVSRHILPNAIQPLMVSAAFSVGSAILTEAVFSFLGIGLKPGEPSWGVMVGEARDYITSDPHLFFFPAGALVFTVLAFAFIGDGLRDALDPKLRGAS
jgi:ABC-type dipeptide/oligopeptide/nickel transport system permease subunit